MEEKVPQMGGEKSRRLVIGTRVCWNNSEADQGTVVENTWSTVRIKWDSGLTAHVHHNDMGEVYVAALKA
jgi:hypothetical protein